MRRRYQKGSLKKADGRWIAQWWDQGSRRKRTLGKVGQLTKSAAEAELAAILAPINARYSSPSAAMVFSAFVSNTYLPFYRRKWKRSTAMTNEDRLNSYLIPALGAEPLGRLDREGLQQFLDQKAAEGLSYSTVAHLRWDLRQILRLATVEGYVRRNPAELLFVPRRCPRPDMKVMTAEEVHRLYSVLDVREVLIAKLAIVAGLRPGEIFALRWGCMDREYADIRERVYRGDLDTPKTAHSIRRAGLADGLRQDIEQWRASSVATRPEAWVFPSEKMTTPLSKDNCWRRHFKPRLEGAGLGWVNFQVMRRTHSCIGADNDVDAKVRADQMGHTVDVNQNVYTRSSLERRLVAVNTIEKALQVM